ncbi:MAG: 4a-hydroxytetrahydrobiopterin dehydratase [Candidatus Pacebacteria bacterium]|jgi:4a-hydroxytetrahydrobiopterin dehydratase|nr:4a-hydroxytetrahydrobiopterin dehydratase [Candidatus Paceibacterota bacterium]
MDIELTKKKCQPCEKKGSKPFDQVEAERYVAEVPGWELSQVHSEGQATPVLKISRTFEFKDFIGSMDFINAVADIAEAEGHHPDIYIFYNKVRLELYTHAIDGLSENDFIVAAKIHRIMQFH